MLDKYLPVITYFLITVVNVYWTWQSLKIRNRDETIKALREQLDLKENAIQEMLKKKNELKYQYHNVVAENKQLHGENTTYKRFNNHTHR